MKVFYSPDYAAAAKSFDTTRKSKWIADSLETKPIEGVEIVAPDGLTFEQIAAVHHPDYVRAVRTGQPRDLAESQGFTWDPGIWRAVTASNGGVVAAARAAMSDGVAGSLSSGLHHAQHATGASFCTFNGLVIAAMTALKEGAKSVLIVDLDAHCGGGTHSLIEEEVRIRQLDVSVNVVDAYWRHPGNSLDIVREPEKYIATIEMRLAEIDQRLDLCLYNAGMDPDERCAIGGWHGMTAEILRQREECVFEWATQRGIPIAFVLAGGYAGGALSQDELVKLHRMTITAAARVRS